MENRTDFKKSDECPRIFMDEAGDSGFSESSSPFFTMGCVIFNKIEEVNACSQTIENLKNELGWVTTKNKSEFHFHRNTDQIRKKFLTKVTQHDFQYYCIAIKKSECKNKFKKTKDMYIFACIKLLENFKNKLDNAIIISDEDGSSKLDQKKLLNHIKNIINQSNNHIHEFKMKRSQSENLIQLADYVVGSVNRSIAGSKKNSNEFRLIIESKECNVEIWP